MSKTPFFLFFYLLILFSACTNRKENRLVSIVKESAYTIDSSKLAVFDPFFNSTRSFNNSIVFYIDFSLHSGNHRLFVYDIDKDSILHKGMVANGSCENAPLGTLYSNKINSYCSSLGMYSIGSSYMGDFGLAYKLHGLQQTNSNAYDRFIVLHAHSCVPNKPVPYSICQSWGCPTVSPNFLEVLSLIIKQSNQPILLYIAADNL